MDAGVASLAADMTPYVMAAVRAYGGAVLAKVRDDAAEATVGLGRRLLLRIFGQKQEGEPLPEVLADVVANPHDTAVLGAFQYTVRKALENDAQMLTEIREMLAEASLAMTVTQNVHAGRDSYVAGRDMTINRPAR